MREAKTWTLIVFQIRSKVLVYFDSEKTTVPLKTFMGKPVFPKLNYIDLLSFCIVLIPYYIGYIHIFYKLDYSVLKLS